MPSGAENRYYSDLLPDHLMMDVHGKHARSVNEIKKGSDNNRNYPYKPPKDKGQRTMQDAYSQQQHCSPSLHSDMYKIESDTAHHHHHGHNKLLFHKTESSKYRDARIRPLHKLSIQLIDSYKAINVAYYERKAKKQQVQQQHHNNNHQHHSSLNPTPKSGYNSLASQNSSNMSISTPTSQQPPGKGVFNNGYDDENYDYILQKDEVLQNRYVVKNRIGKGSFGQVARGYDKVSGNEVAIKIIKSRYVRPWKPTYTYIVAN